MVRQALSDGKIVEKSSRVGRGRPFLSRALWVLIAGSLVCGSSGCADPVRFSLDAEAVGPGRPTFLESTFASPARTLLPYCGLRVAGEGEAAKGDLSVNVWIRTIQASYGVGVLAVTGADLDGTVSLRLDGESWTAKFKASAEPAGSIPKLSSNRFDGSDTAILRALGLENSYQTALLRVMADACGPQSVYAVLLDYPQGVAPGRAAEVLAERADAESIGLLLRAIDGPPFWASKARKSLVKQAAIAAAGSTRRREFLGPLLAALQEEDRLLRSVAAEALGNLGEPEAVDALLRVANEDVDGRVREKAAAALKQLEGR